MNNEFECRYLFEPIKEHEIISIMQYNLNKAIDIQINRQFDNVIIQRPNRESKSFFTSPSHQTD